MGLQTATHQFVLYAARGNIGKLCIHYKITQ
jgi:hypothetical protein